VLSNEQRDGLPRPGMDGMAPHEEQRRRSFAVSWSAVGSRSTNGILARPANFLSAGGPPHPSNEYPARIQRLQSNIASRGTLRKRRPRWDRESLCVEERIFRGRRQTRTRPKTNFVPRQRCTALRNRDQNPPTIAIGKTKTKQEQRAVPWNRTSKVP